MVVRRSQGLKGLVPIRHLQAESQVSVMISGPDSQQQQQQQRHTPQPAETGRRQKPRGSLQKSTRGCGSRSGSGCCARVSRCPSTHPQCGKCLTQIQASLARQVPREKQVLDAASDHE